jgi:hypothetical protein
MRYMLAVFLCLLPAMAQEIKLPPGIEKLADKATEVVDVTLDQNLLQLASRFLSDKDGDEARVKKLVAGLKGIWVRSFEFEKPGEYLDSDVEAIRSQLRAPGWSRIVGVRSRKAGENAEVYLKTEGGLITGLTVVSAEPRELTIVNIAGPIRPEDLQELGGRFGIPKLSGTVPSPKAAGESKKEE